METVTMPVLPTSSADTANDTLDEIKYESSPGEAEKQEGIAVWAENPITGTSKSTSVTWRLNESGFFGIYFC